MKTAAQPKPAKPAEELKVHPIAKRLPPLSEAEYESLKADCVALGLIRRPIVLLQGMILDGRHRYRIHQQTGLPFKTEKFDPARHAPTPEQFVYSEAQGRNMTESQRACAAVRFKGDLTKQAKARSKANLKKGASASRPDTGVQSGAEPRIDGQPRHEWTRRLRCQTRAEVFNEYARWVLKDAKAKDGGGRPFADMVDAVVETMFKHAPVRSRDVAGSLFGVSGSLVQQAEALYKADKKLFEKVFNGNGTVASARNQLTHRQREREIGDLKIQSAKAPRDCRIIVGDCLDVMFKADAIKPRSVACVFTDIPYNNGWTYDADPTGDKIDQDEFVDYWMKRFGLAALMLKDDGSLFVMIDDANSDLIGAGLRKLGLYRQPTIVWWEHFPVNNAHGMAKAARFIHHYAKSPKPYINTVELRVPSKRQTEYADARANPIGKLPDNVWQVNRVTGNRTDAIPFKDAPPQLPFEVPERCILLTTKPGDLVLDICNGNGTTAVAALRNNRRYVGIERSAKYAKQSEKWIPTQLKEGK